MSGQVCSDLEWNELAEQNYRTALQINPNDSAAYVGLGVLCRKRGDLDGAMQYYQRAVALNPKGAQAYSSMAIIEMKRSNDRKALEYAEKASKLDSKDATLAANLAVAYHYNNRIADRDRMCAEAERLGYRGLDSVQAIFRGEKSMRD